MAEYPKQRFSKLLYGVVNAAVVEDPLSIEASFVHHDGPI